MAIGGRALVGLFLGFSMDSDRYFSILFPFLNVENDPLAGMLGGYDNMSDCLL